VPVTAGGGEQSTLDLFGRGFVLLAGPDGGEWCTAAGSGAGSFGVDLRAYRIGVDVTAPHGVLEASLGTGAAGAVLVRPDGFVSWRSSVPGRAPEQELSRALGAALGRGGAVAAG
jgi:hypothetical protein